MASALLKKANTGTNDCYSCVAQPFLAVLSDNLTFACHARQNSARFQ